MIDNEFFWQLWKTRILKTCHTVSPSLKKTVEKRGFRVQKSKFYTAENYELKFTTTKEAFKIKGFKSFQSMVLKAYGKSLTFPQRLWKGIRKTC